MDINGFLKEFLDVQLKGSGDVVNDEVREIMLEQYHDSFNLIRQRCNSDKEAVYEFARKHGVDVQAPKTEPPKQAKVAQFVAAGKDDPEVMEMTRTGLLYSNIIFGFAWLLLLLAAIVSLITYFMGYNSILVTFALIGLSVLFHIGQRRFVSSMERFNQL